MKKTNRGGSRLLIGLMFLFLYLPIILLIIFSFNAGDSSAVWKGFSLHWYRELFGNRLIMESLYITLLVSLLHVSTLLPSPQETEGPFSRPAPHLPSPCSNPRQNRQKRAH